MGQVNCLVMIAVIVTANITPYPTRLWLKKSHAGGGNQSLPCFMRGLTLTLKNKSYNFLFFFFGIHNRQKVEIPAILKGKLYDQY